MNKSLKEKLTIFVVNFNTSDITNLCLDQIELHCNNYDYTVTLLDNSTKDSFVPSKKRSFVEYLDNTKNDIIDYNKFVKENCKGNDPGNYATPKHAHAIDWMIGRCRTKHLLILDSDAILKKDIDFIDDNFCTIADIGKDFNVERFLPMIQYINIDEFRKHNLFFCDSKRIRFGLDFKYNGWDTGACLYKDVIDKKLKYKKINMNDYIIHIGGSSWKQIRNYDFIKKRNTKELISIKNTIQLSKIKIIVCHHKEAPLIEDYKNKNIYINVFGGKDNYKGNNKFLLELVGDNTGDNISNKNHLFNELTTVYWAWKNYESIGNPEYIGLNHYRRIFNSEDIVDYKNYDVILWESILPGIKCGNKTMKEQFLVWHKQNTINKLFEYIEKYKPEYKFIKDYFDKKEFFAKNMFIMKKEIFFEYCELLFPFILDLSEKYNMNEYFRECSFISERISSTIFSELSKKYKTKFLQIPYRYI